MADELRTAIHQREYRPNDRLPSEAELAASHGLSRQTVRRVLHQLSTEGLVYTEQGRGTFVADHQDNYQRQIGSILNLLALTPHTQGKLIEPLHEEIRADAAETLGLNDDRVLAVTLLRVLDGRPLCVFTSYAPPAVEAGVLAWQSQWPRQEPIDERSGLVHGLEAHLDHPVTEADQVITAVPAPHQQAQVLGVEPGDPLLEVQRTYLTANQERILFTISHFVPELYSYRVTLRREPA